MPKGDDLCPLGFAPHSIRPTRCKRCFRDYGEHKKKTNGSKTEEKTPSSKDGDDRNKTGPKNTDKKEDKNETAATGSAASPKSRSEHSVGQAAGDAKGIQTTPAKPDTVVRRRRPQREDDEVKVETETPRRRQRTRPGSWSGPNGDNPENETTGGDSPFRQKDWAKNIGPEQETAVSGSKGRRVQILSAQELLSSVVDESIIPESTSADVEFILQVKTSTFNQDRRHEEEDDDVSVAATETTETTLTYHDSIEDLQATIQTLKRQCDEWEQRCHKLETDKRELQACKTSEKDRETLEKTAAELLKLRSKIFEMESLNEDLRDENNVLKLEVKELQEEVDGRPPAEEVSKRLAELQQKLHATEAMCEELVEENDEYKKEINEMEDEIEEMQDSFREDQADEYRDLRKELEQTAKNCRILQFKLRKTERRCEHLEMEKSEVEDKLKLITNADNIDMDKIERIKSLESEVKGARDVSVAMHAEMEALKAKLRQAETERNSLGNTLSKAGAKLGLKESAVKKATVVHPNLEKSQKESDDSAQLMRELYDSMEREKDLKEQLKFSEAEATSLRKKLTSLEEENESVMLQLKKMASVRAAKGKRPGGGTGSGRESPLGTEASEDAGGEPSLQELKLQLELVEQEAGVVRNKLKEMQDENESLTKEIKFLEGALSLKESSKAELPPPPPQGQQQDVYYEQRIKLLETEAKELRRKLIERERENEQLTAEINAKAGRRGSKAVPAVQRSRSLDGDVQIDLRRQLQLVEQEAGILRQKTLDLESENEKLCAENRKLQIRGNKKGPLTPGEKLALENLQLKDAVASLEKKLSAGATAVNEVKEAGNTTEGGGDKKPKEEAAAAGTNGAPKKGTLSTRLREQVSKLEGELTLLKKRVEELERENNSLKKMKNVTNYKQKATGDEGSAGKKALEEAEKLRAELSRAKNDLETSETKHRIDLQKMESKNTQLSERLDEEEKKYRISQEEILQLQKEKENLEKANTRAQKKLNDGEINALKKKVESLERDLANEKQNHGEIRKKIDKGELVDFEALRKVEEEKHKLRKEIVDNQKKTSDLEKKIGELEQTVKDCGKTQRSLKRELEEAQRELENEKAKLKKVDSRQSEVAVGWLKEREELKKQASDSERQHQLLAEQMEKDEKKWQDKVQELDGELAEQKKTAARAIQEKEKEMRNWKDQVNKLKVQLDEMETKSAAKGGEHESEYLEKWKRLDAIYRREKEEWLTKQVDFEGELKAEVRRRDRMERDHEAELRDRDEDMLTLKDKIRRADQEIKRLSQQRGDAVGDLEDRLKDLEKQLALEKQEYEDLTSKYELLEEDYVVVKAQGVMAKEQVQSNYNALRRDHTELEGELKTLRETFNVRQDTWIKEKLDMQEKIKELSGKLSRSNAAAWDLERARLKDLVEEKTMLCDQLKKDEKHHKEEMERLRRQSEDTKRKLDDYDRVKSYGKSTGGQEVAAFEKEIQDLKSKLLQEEKGHRSELAATKMKMDQRVAHLQDEIHALHLQNAKFRREKETIKEMLEGAQKTITDLKTDTIRKDKSEKIFAEMDELKQKLDQARKEKEEILDKLDVSERNCSKVKTEFMTERASWEIKTAEMQTKINELEETTILQGGRSKIFGVKTKLELAWQKEREEQHRLLTESHKMARDMKQRLLDVEGARDKERMDSKKHLDEFRKTVDAGHVETQKKIDELQNDHLQLRDAHSKMRAMNDRMKREKARMEGERDELRIFLSEMQQIHSQDRITIASLVEELHKMKTLVPTILGEPPDGGSERSSRQTAANDESLKHAFKAALNRISIATEELRRAHGAREEDRVKRNLSFRRAISEDEDDDGSPRTSGVRRRDDPLSRWQNPQRVTNYPASPPSMYISIPKRQSLYRKSLSLDQTFNVDSVLGQSRSIWKSTDSGESNSSLAASVGDSSAPTPSPRLRKHQKKLRQQGSVESDVSGTSADSRDISVERDQSSASEAGKVKTGKKGGIKEKFKRLTKAKSIEGTPTADHIRQAGFQVLSPALSNTGSSSSVTSETQKDVKGKDLKSRIANLFKKSSSRSSLDRDSLDGDTGKSNTLRPKSSSAKTAALPRYGSTSALNQLKLDMKTSQSSTLRPLSNVGMLRSQFLSNQPKARSEDNPMPKAPTFSETQI